MCLDRDVATLSKIPMQKYPRCTSNVANMAASGSSNDQSNCKENGGYPPIFHPQQKSPVEYVLWLNSFFSCLRTISSGYNLVHHRYRNPSVSPARCNRLLYFRLVFFSIAHLTSPTFRPQHKSLVKYVQWLCVRIIWDRIQPTNYHIAAIHQRVNREYVYSAVVYQKYLTRLRN